MSISNALFAGRNRAGVGWKRHLFAAAFLSAGFLATAVTAAANTGSHPGATEPGALDFASVSTEDTRAWLFAKGEEVYLTGGTNGIACATCHQADGTGIPGAFPALAGQVELLSDCASEARFIVTGERPDRGALAGVMPPLPSLTDLEIAAVLTYERNAWGNDYGVCLPEQVESARN
jgi:mono/diheme cytochrome c family protein